MRPVGNVPGRLPSCGSPGLGTPRPCCGHQGCLRARGAGCCRPLRRARGAEKGRGPRSEDCPGVTGVLPIGRDSPTASTLSSRQYLVWLVVASRTWRWSWVKSRTSWPGKTQTCRVPLASWRHVETLHAVGTSLRNGEWGPAAPHASCPGPGWRRGDLGHGTETSVSPVPSLCPPVHHPHGTEGSHGPSPAAGCVVAAV